MAPREIPTPVFESTTEDSSDYSDSDSEPEPPKKVISTAAALLPKPPVKADSSSDEESSSSDDEPVPAKKATPRAAALPKKPQAKPLLDSSSEDYSSDSDDEPVPAKKATPAAALPKKPQANSSSDEDTSNSDSDSEPLPAKKTTPVAARIHKPLFRGRPALESSSSETDTSSDSIFLKPALAKTPAPAFPAAGSKRPATSAPGADEKRSKKKAEGSAVKKGKKPIERIFSTEDEIIVLEELLKHHPIKEDSSEMDDFYGSIKDRLSAGVTKAQVQDKIGKLKIKFFNQMEKNANKKEKKNGSNSEEEELEMMVYELSEEIWGHKEGPKSAGGGIAQKLEETMEEDEEMEEKKIASYDFGGRPVEEWIFGEGVELLDDEARSKLENEWKELKKEEVGLFVKKYELLHRHAVMVYDAMTSKDRVK